MQGRVLPIYAFLPGPHTSVYLLVCAAWPLDPYLRGFYPAMWEGARTRSHHRLAKQPLLRPIKAARFLVRNCLSPLSHDGVIASSQFTHSLTYFFGVRSLYSQSWFSGIPTATPFPQPVSYFMILTRLLYCTVSPGVHTSLVL